MKVKSGVILFLFFLIVLMVFGVFSSTGKAEEDEGVIVLKKKQTYGVVQEKNNAGTGKISLAFKNTPAIEILSYFSTRFNVGYVFEYPSLGVKQEEIVKEVFAPVSSPAVSSTGLSTGIPTIVPTPASAISSTTVPSTSSQSSSEGSVTDVEKRVISFSLHNATIEEALQKFCEAADFECNYDKQKNLLKIKPYQLYIADCAVFFDYDVSYDLGLQGTTSSSGVMTSASSSFTGGGSASTNTSTNTYKFSEKFEDLLDKIKNLLSSEGKAILSKRGYIVVLDRPSRVEKIRSVIEKEIEKQKPVFLNVKVVRIDKTKTREVGIDWDVLINNLFSTTATLQLQGSYTSQVGGLASGGGLFTANLQGNKVKALLSYLENYGDVNVVHDWAVKARGGIPVVFSDIQSIPYLNQQTVMQEGTSVTSTTPSFVDVGIKIGVDGTTEGDYYKGQVFVSISQLISLQNLGTSDSPFFVPNVKSSVVTIPISLKLGEAMVVSGFKIHRINISKSGIPVLSNIPILGYLFGYYGKEQVDSELAVIIMPERIERVASLPSESRLLEEYTITKK